MQKKSGRYLLSLSDTLRLTRIARRGRTILWDKNRSLSTVTSNDAEKTNSGPVAMALSTCLRQHHQRDSTLGLFQLLMGLCRCFLVWLPLLALLRQEENKI